MLTPRSPGSRLLPGSGRHLSAIAATAGAALLCALAPGPAAGVTISKREKVVLSVSPMSSEGTLRCGADTLRLEVDPRSGATGGCTLEWPGRGDATSLVLTAKEGVPDAGQDHAVVLQAELVLADGTRANSTRRHAFSDRSTFLFEIYRRDDRPLTLVVEADTTLETKVSSAPDVGAPLLLLLEIQRVRTGEAVSLETNRLSAFVGQPVSYSFRLGDQPDSESAEVRFTPLRVVGSIAEIRVELSGKLPTADGSVRMMSRSEQWIASRDALSTLDFTAGEPPDGYRFLVTARF
jgi:hypothetical protein